MLHGTFERAHSGRRTESVRMPATSDSFMGYVLQSTQLELGPLYIRDFLDEGAFFVLLRQVRMWYINIKNQPELVTTLPNFMFEAVVENETSTFLPSVIAVRDSKDCADWHLDAEVQPQPIVGGARVRNDVSTRVGTVTSEMAHTTKS
eukprot:TRINITY_DN21715_c0_g1_i4.p1 TRINITY_DN21715_c0_g1~~TRINITY_DN21715_c0_g1_i4.p1  ORF type:complete len:148 (+),score=7.21 TRINITY_DN21715_c0_g1_i4:496-939(+)